MERDNYTLLEVILGLRREYLKNEEKLRELKDCCGIHDGIRNRNIKDFYFYVSQLRGKNPDLFCEFIEKDNVFRNLVDLIWGLDFNRNVASCSKNNNDEYYLNGFRKNPYPVYVKYDNERQFAERASEILNSTFVNDIGMEISTSDINSLRINKNVVLMLKTSNRNNIFVEYISGIDKIQISNSALDNIIDSSLNVQIPSKELSMWHINTINNSGIFEKEIVLDKLELCKNVEFNIYENDKQIVLTKVR